MRLSIDEVRSLLRMHSSKVWGFDDGYPMEAIRRMERAGLVKNTPRPYPKWWSGREEYQEKIKAWVAPKPDNYKLTKAGKAHCAKIMKTANGPV